MSRTRLCVRNCLLLASLVGFGTTSLIAQVNSAQQPAAQRSQSVSGSQRPLKEELADAAKNVTLWLLSAPTLPAICFGAAAILAVGWTWLAVKHRIRILTGTVTIAGEGVDKIALQVRAPSGYSSTLNSSHGMFTVYDIPDENLELELTLSDSAASAPAGGAPNLKYNLNTPVARTLQYHVELPLRPDALTKTNTGANDRAVSWKDPTPSPAAANTVMHYVYTLEVGVRGTAGFVPLAFTTVASGQYSATVQKESIVKFTTQIDGLSPQLTTYLPVS